MKTSVVFSSKTGNTQQLANTVAAALPKQELLYTGAPNEAALAADRLYIGFWTDKGSCNSEITDFEAGQGQGGVPVRHSRLWRGRSLF